MQFEPGKHEPVEDRSTGDYQQHFVRRADEQTSQVVVRALRSVCGADVGELEPLYPTINLEALDALVDRSTESAPISVTFEYPPYLVTVYGDERVTIQSPSETFVEDAPSAPVDRDRTTE
jgi:hypothetical protein